MPNRLIMQRLDHITLVRKGKAIPKHPDLREGVVEVVKSEDFDWYDAFVDYINNCPDDEIPSSWEEGFESYLTQDENQLTEVAKAAKKKNYSDSEGPFAGPHNSFPINSQERVYSAAKLIGHAANPAAVKARIISIARSKGYSLPKSWQSKVSKSDSILDVIKKALGLAETSDPTLFDAVVEEDVEKARSAASSSSGLDGPSHAHDHAHLSRYGYSYSHSHSHGHRDGVTPDSNDHDTHETAHAHLHVAKSSTGEDMSEDLKEMLADIKGLAGQVELLKNENKVLSEKVTTHEATIAEVTKSRDEALAAKAEAEKASSDAVEKAKSLEAERDSVTQKLDEQSRKPLVGGPAPVQKSEPNVKQMKFDEAFDAVMERQSPLPRA